MPGTMAYEAYYSIPEYKHDKYGTPVAHMSFGKYVGERLVDIPPGYVNWMINDEPGFFDNKPTLLSEFIKLGKIKRGLYGLEAVGHSSFEDYFGWFGGPESSDDNYSYNDAEYWDEDEDEDEEEDFDAQYAGAAGGNGFHGRASAGAADAAGHGRSEHAESQQRTPKGQSSHAHDRGAAEEPPKKRQRAEAPPVRAAAAGQAADLSYLCQRFPSLDKMTVAELKKVLQQVMTGYDKLR